MPVRIRFEVVPPRRKKAPLRLRQATTHWRALAVVNGKRHHLSAAHHPVLPDEVGPFLKKAAAKLTKLGVVSAEMLLHLQQMEAHLRAHQLRLPRLDEGEQ